MSAVLASLVVLVSGALVSALLARRPHTALCSAMLAIVSASGLCLVTALPCLAPGAGTQPTTVDWPLPLGHARLALDGLSAWFLATIALMSGAVAVYGWAYMRAEIGRGSVPALGAFLCLLVAALILVVCAADVVLFLVGWELMMLASFFLIAFHHREREVRHAAWMYLVANHLGTALFVVPLFGILAARAGALDFHAFRAALTDAEPSAATVLFLLGLLGFGTKAGFMPMHIWLPVAHPAAPAPVSALLSGVVIKVGIYGLLRLLGWLPALPLTCTLLMLAFAIVSGVLGVLYALAQHEIKRLLAYHSVENIGIIGVGIGMGMLGHTLGQPALMALGYGGALLHVLNHALFKGLLFLSAGAVIHSTGVGDIERLGGLARRTPINAAMFLLGAVAICGLPPLNGFVSEWILYGALFRGAWSGSRLASAAAALGVLSLALMGGLALACFAKVFGVVFLGEPRDATIRAHPTPGFMRLGMFLPAMLCVAIGVLPALFVPLVLPAVSTLGALNPVECAEHMRPALSALVRVSLLAGALLATGGALVLVRQRVLRRETEASAPAVVTWGCGYARPTARMQYTASSFAWSLIESFRGVLWSHRKLVTPVGPFAGRAELESHTVDMAEHDFFAPLFRGASRAFRMIRNVSWSGEPVAGATPVDSGGRVGPVRLLATGIVSALRQGRVHVYMAFIVLTLLLVFLVEALASREPSEPPAPPGVRAAEGILK